MPESQISDEIILNTTTNVIQNMFAFACIILHSLTVSLSHHKVSTKGLHYSIFFFIFFFSVGLTWIKMSIKSR